MGRAARLPSPRRTGYGDFPLPALLNTVASGMHRQLRGVPFTQFHQPKSLEVVIQRNSFRRSERPLAAPPQMTNETVSYEPVNLVVGALGVSEAEIVCPTS